MRMPEISGVQLIQKLTAQCADTVAMVLTGATDIELAMSAINEARVFRFYTKPCASDVLASGIEQALAQVSSKDHATPPSPEAALGVATLNRLPTGVVVVDGQPRVLFMNSLGAEYLARNDGLTIGPTGICRASRAGDSAELHRLIKAATSGDPNCVAHALSLSRDAAERPLSVVIAPLAAEPGVGPTAVLLISDPGRQPLPSVETVTRLFDLTETEARLALLLSDGQRIEDAAASLGVTLSSARTYLKRIFSKTDVTRQAELVRLILAAPNSARLAGGPAVEARHAQTDRNYPDRDHRDVGHSWFGAGAAHLVRASLNPRPDPACRRFGFGEGLRAARPRPSPAN